jgi:mono/diheme cytochrome c family protein
MLAATIVSRAQDPAIQRVFDLVAQAKVPAWQRSALLRGAEVTLLAADAPGSEGRGRGRGAASADAPCPTCPGGRAGPGGAAAFPTPRGGGDVAAAPAGGRGRGAARPALKLAHEPALVALAAANAGDLSSRANSLLVRVEWPGKPGMVTVTPLTAAEQARFDAGKTVYQNLCQACHQPDGRGREHLAPALVGSAFALAADPGIPIRIVLSGKEGPVGLMPPLGAALSDDQIAAVLTYVRREWGHTASPVAASNVAAVRPQVASRTRPWTNDELNALLAGGR